MTERRKVNNGRLTHIESAEIFTYGEISNIWKQIVERLKQLLARTYFTTLSWLLQEYKYRKLC